MTEKKSPLKTMLLIFPILFGMVMLAAIIWPLFMFAGAIAQLGLHPRAVMIMVLAVPVMLDIVALMKLYETKPRPTNHLQWLALIIFVPYVGSTICLIKNLNPDK